MIRAKAVFGLALRMVTMAVGDHVSYVTKRREAGYLRSMYSDS